MLDQSHVIEEAPTSNTFSVTQGSAIASTSVHIETYPSDINNTVYLEHYVIVNRIMNNDNQYTGIFDCVGTPV